MQRLHEDIMQRRARAHEAETQVAALKSKTSQQFAEVLTPWLHDAFEMELVEVLKEEPGQPDRRIFTDAQGHRFLLLVLDGATFPNWQHVNAAYELGYDLNVESVAIASYMSPDEDLQKEAEDKQVKLWSAPELEAIYQNIEFETAGVSIF
jgi:hypothetical protein